jgi:hypothetical protein
MSFKQLYKSLSVPNLRRQLSFSSSTLAPGIPVEDPLDVEIAKIDSLIDFIDFLLEDAINDFTILTWEEMQKRRRHH